MSVSMSEVKKAPEMSQCLSSIPSWHANDIIDRIAVNRLVGVNVVEYSSSVCMSPRATNLALNLAIVLSGFILILYVKREGSKDMPGGIFTISNVPISQIVFSSSSSAIRHCAASLDLCASF